MEIKEREPFGLEISGIQATALRGAQIAGIIRHLSRHGVIVFRDQDTDDDGMETFLSRLGTPMMPDGAARVAGHPCLNRVGGAGPPMQAQPAFHTDASHVARPPAFTALRPVGPPGDGGAMLVADAFGAYEALEADAKTQLRGLWARHAGGDASGNGHAPRETWHPLLRRHPVSGRVAVFLSAPERCDAVSDLPGPEGSRLIRRLHAEITKPDNVLRHEWRRGDLLIWDNRCTLHAAEGPGVSGERVLHRGMIRGEIPRAA